MTIYEPSTRTAPPAVGLADARGSRSAADPQSAARATSPDDVVVRIAGLHIGFRGDPDVVTGVDLTVRRGEVVAIVGESGSGKSVTTRSIVGLAGDGARVRADRFEVLGDDVSDLGERDWRRFRGSRIGLILQDALTALDPLRTVTKEITEGLSSVPRRERAQRVESLLTSVGIDDPATTRARRSFQLSGGQRQRALIAAALAGDPDLLIADEPTTALDVTVQAQILELIATQARAGRAVILVSHDLAVVSALADRVLVMQGGRIVEEGPTRDVIDRPVAAYTRELLAAVPGGAARPPLREVPGAVPLLTARGLRKSYRSRGQTIPAVSEVSFEVHDGEVLGIVGESGSGKSTIASMITGSAGRDAGELLFLGAPHPAPAHVGRIGLVAQDSVGSFDPRHLVREIIAEGVGASATAPENRADRVLELLEAVHLPPDVAARHPRELSGGQRQRVNIARALGADPRLIVCDEPVSALDISVQAQILDLLHELTESRRLALVFISHDLAVVRRLCHRLVVLHRGRVVEEGPAEQVFEAPADAYTRDLLAAIPTL
ncbi:ATP-binding cassette domain-containing protein [Gordonia soli]|uniref:Putative peptide ABC transporter ATP-binding protein n=1 Tax=Gordonia soli NBRC 108243 TaxID=1223545 RepID=M0QHV8_9ACTN|nr:ABC transporter ATP-binding protein [Gordonia soli]GAC67861.1 putative peptide ABC transporter ATP-binding protein [Gordonia soli NBRC 108243]